MPATPDTIATIAAKAAKAREAAAAADAALTAAETARDARVDIARGDHIMWLTTSRVPELRAAREAAEGRFITSREDAVASDGFGLDTLAQVLVTLDEYRAAGTVFYEVAREAAGLTHSRRGKLTNDIGAAVSPPAPVQNVVAGLTLSGVLDEILQRRSAAAVTAERKANAVREEAAMLAAEVASK